MENEMRKVPFVLAIAAILPLLSLGKAARADDVRPAMESANTQFLAGIQYAEPVGFSPALH